MRFPRLLSSLTIGIVLSTCLLIDLDLKNWRKQDRVIEWDIHWYYSYLPATFIYDNIKLENPGQYLFGKDYYLFWPIQTPDGKNIIKTTMGLSILYSPFFFAAHGYAGLFGYPQDGCSIPYKVFLLLGTIFYLFIGLVYVRKILRHYSFSELHIAITLALLGLGTNLLCYASQQAPMPHAYNFCLFAVLFYYTIRWYESPNVKHTLIVGFLIGLIALIRPSNAVVAIFFGLYGVNGMSSLKERFVLFWKKLPLVLLMLLPVALVWLPQFIYWKIATGNFMFYSYTHERFFFDDPKIIQGLFSFRKGWLVYTPMMAFALIGIVLLRDKAKEMRTALLVFMALNFYIIFSWWCWWYGGTFGQRSLIESYAFLAVPLAAFVKFIWERKWYLKAAFSAIALFFIWLNIFQTYQFEYQSLHSDGMSKELYFRQFGKLERIEGFDNYVDWPKNQDAMQGRNR